MLVIILLCWFSMLAGFVLGLLWKSKGEKDVR
jgi:hypothetical protein